MTEALRWIGALVVPLLAVVSIRIVIDLIFEGTGRIRQRRTKATLAELQRPLHSPHAETLPNLHPG